MPFGVETVEARCEAIPRDMKCHVYTDGNVHDSAFGMNWKEVVSDGRTANYKWLQRVI